MINKQSAIQIQVTMPQTIMSRELLQMPAILLRDYLSRAIIDNPFLELGYPATEEMICGIACPPARREGFEAESYESVDASLSLMEELCGEQRDSLYEVLRFQSALLDLSKEDRNSLNYLIALINEDGYFLEDISEISKELHISDDIVLRLLKIIQGFYPPGVGARNLQECLMLQVNPDSPYAYVIQRIIEEDLAKVARHSFAALERKYHLSMLCLQKAVREIQSLNPRPGMLFGGETTTQYIYPEASVLIEGASLRLKMNNEPGKMLVFDENYMRDIDDAEARLYLKQKRLEALNLLNSLGMRQAMIRRLLLYLMQEQREFFYGGKTHLKPLSMRETADALGVHPSTITRCVREKYIETPWGVVPLKQLFQSASGNEELSAEHVCQLIRQLIDGERKTLPLSDEEISIQLRKDGIHISRRTVSKYREQLGIPSQRKRRKNEEDS